MVKIVETEDAPATADTPYVISVGDVFQGSLSRSEENSSGFGLPADVFEINIEREGIYEFHVGAAASGVGTLSGITIARYADPMAVGTEETLFDATFETSDFTGGSTLRSDLPVGTYYFMIAGVSGTYQFALTDLGDDPDFSTAGETITGSPNNDVIEGTVGNDSLFGLDGDDTLIGQEGDDFLVGGAGFDTVQIAAAADDHTVSFRANGDVVVENRSEIFATDRLVEIESIDFGSGTDLDLAALQGVTNNTPEDLAALTEMYIAYFNRAPDALGLYFWGTAFANGSTLDEIATLFLDQDETRALYPEGTTNLEFVNQVYSNVLGRVPDQDGVEFWSGALETGGVSRDAFILEVLRGAKADAPADATPEFIELQAADQAYLETKTDIGTYFAAIRGMSDTTDATEAMALFDRTVTSSLETALNRIDSDHTTASQDTNGDLLLQLVGIIDNPFPA